MALVVEDGAGVADAESLCSIAFADEYCDKRGQLSWLDLSESEKEAALRKATDYIESRYGLKFSGSPVAESQALSWPRVGATYGRLAIPSNVVPTKIRMATVELALKAMAGDALAPDVGKTVISEKVGEIAVTYAETGPQTTQYTGIHMLVAPFLETPSGLGATTKLYRS